MGVLDQLQNVLQQYSSGSAAPQNAEQVSEHFKQVAAVAPQGSIADALSAAFRSNDTPPFGQMLSGMFSQSNGEQKAGILNQLIGSVGPGALASLAGGGALASLLKGGGQITPQQAEQVSPEAVQQLANHAEKANPSVIDQASAFYAQHSTLVNAVGAGALAYMMSHMQKKSA